MREFGPIERRLPPLPELPAEASKAVRQLFEQVRTERRRLLAKAHLDAPTPVRWTTDGVEFHIIEKMTRAEDGFLQVRVEATAGGKPLPWDTEREDNPIIFLDPRLYVRDEDGVLVEDIVAAFREQVEAVVLDTARGRGWQP